MKTEGIRTIPVVVLERREPEEVTALETSSLESLLE